MPVINPGLEAARSIRSRRLPGIRILGTGYGLPEHSVSNDELQTPGCDSEWIVQRTGIRSRYHAGPEVATSDLAIAAAKNCLENAGISASKLDLIILCTMTPDHYTPSTACLVQAALGATCGAMDLNAACSGFVYGLVTASHFIHSGSCQRVLVVAADKMSVVIDPDDPRTWPLFGDGAGAVLVTGENAARSEAETGENAPGLLAWRLGSEGELGSSLVVPACGSRMPASPQALADRQQYLKMDGRSVFKWAVRLVPEIVMKLVEDAGIQLRDVDVFLLHQANRRIIDAAADQMGIDVNRVFVNVDRFGNTSAASVPILMHECVRDGHIHAGQLVMAVGFGAGLTWGGCLLRW